MTKYEFIQETDNILGDVVYYTRSEGIFIQGSLSHDREKAWQKFLNIASNVEPTKIEVLETIYSPIDKNPQRG